MVFDDRGHSTPTQIHLALFLELSYDARRPQRPSKITRPVVDGLASNLFIESCVEHRRTVKASTLN